MDIKKMYPPQKDSPSTFLTGDIGPADIFLFVGSFELLPSVVPFPLTLGIDKTVTETVIVTEIGVNGQLTVTRGPLAVSWSAGTRCARVWNSDDLIALQHNISETVAEIETHKDADMPHIMRDMRTGILYRYGFGINASGTMVFIFEEAEG